MKLDNIRAASNGFILEDGFGSVYVAKTLYEAAHIAGEAMPMPSNATVMYAPCAGADQLASVKALAVQGYKIDAIKKLRDCFIPKLGLKEAKEMVEILCQ